MISSKPSYIHNKILVFLLLIFIAINPEIPYSIGKYVRSDYGLVILFIMTSSLFFTNDYLIIVLGCIVSYIIFVKSGEYHQTKKYASSEAEKIIRYDMYNSKTISLEEEMITTSEPRIKKVTKPPNYKPYMDNVHAASSVTTI